jgi:hypothetical protein
MTFFLPKGTGSMSMGINAGTAMAVIGSTQRIGKSQTRDHTRQTTITLSHFAKAE